MATVRGGGPYLRARIDYTVTALTNGAKVSASLYAENCNDAYFQAHAYGTYKLTVNGSVASGSGAALSGSMNGAVKLLDKTVTINYTGNHSNITIKGEIPSVGVTINGTYITARSVSASVALPKVGTAPTKGTITAPGNSVISETATTIPITWSKGTSYNGSGMYRIDVKINNGAYTFVSGDINFSSSSHPTSWTYTIPSGNRVQGTTFAFQMDTGNDVGWSGHTYSGTVTMNKLNAPTIGTINTYNPYLGTLSIPVSGGSQTSGEQFKRISSLIQGSTWRQDCSEWGTRTNNSGWGNTTCTFTATGANFATWLGTKAYSGTFKISSFIWNSRNSRSATVEKTFTVNLNSDGGATPTIASDAVTISGGKTATIFLVGKNNVAVSIASSKCATRRTPSGTSLSYKIECTGKSTFTGNSTSFSGMTAGKKTIKAIVTDSRGLASSQTKYVYFQPYSAPTATITSAVRLDSPNTTATITYTLGFTSVKNCDANGNLGTTEQNGYNSLQYRVDGGSWVSTSLPSGNTGTFNVTGLAAEATHTIQLRVCDKMYTDAGIGSNTVTIPTMNVGLALRKSRVGINCVPQSGEALSVNGYSNLKGNLNVTGTATIGGTSTFTGLLTANGDISIPEGRSPIDGGTIRAGSISFSDSICASSPNYKSFVGTVNKSNEWWNLISIRHRNGCSDGNLYGMFIGSKLQNSNHPLIWNKQQGGSWLGYDRYILDSSTYICNFSETNVNGLITKLEAQNSYMNYTTPIIPFKGKLQNGPQGSNAAWYRGFYFMQNGKNSDHYGDLGSMLITNSGGFWLGQISAESKNGNVKLPNWQAILTRGNILSFIYPVGSGIWLKNGLNPATLYGGTWQAQEIVLAPSSNTSYVMDVHEGKIQNNQNLQIYTWNGSVAQRFHVYGSNVNGGTTTVNMIFWVRTA